MPRFRRSSTARSIGARSDFDAGEANGYDDENEGGSVTHEDNPDRQREKAEAEEHMRDYITQQLERVKTEQGDEGYSKGDEFEAQA